MTVSHLRRSGQQRTAESRVALTAPIGAIFPKATRNPEQSERLTELAIQASLGFERIRKVAEPGTNVRRIGTDWERRIMSALRRAMATYEQDEGASRLDANDMLFGVLCGALAALGHIDATAGQQTLYAAMETESTIRTGLSNEV